MLSLRSLTKLQKYPGFRPNLLANPSKSCGSRRLFTSFSAPCRKQSPNDIKQTLARQNLINEIQKNPQILQNAGASLGGRLLSWKTVLVLVISSSTLTMGVYLAVQVYQVSRAEPDSKPRNVFLPLWVSFDWPYQRRYAFPSYLRYVDPEFYSHVESTDRYAERLHEENVQYQILDGLFRLPAIRDRFGIPFSLKTSEADSFDMWIEPKHPTVHGPQIHISKESGRIVLSWQWSVKLVHWWSSVDSFLKGMGTKLDRLDSSPALQKTHEKGSGRVHEVIQPLKNNSVPCGDRDYRVMFSGTFRLSDASKFRSGTVSYTGVIDFNHLGINRGARIALLVVDSEGVAYKVS